MPYTGSCLCGSVKIKVDSTEEKQVACHCDDCKQTSGSAFSTNILPKIAQVHFDGNVKEYESPAASGNTVTRVFCGTCGSALAHKSKAFGDAMAVQTGNLPDFKHIPFGAELFVKDRYDGLAAIADADQVQVMPA
ncbi:hypothetical protein IAU60_002876 [Kwoniella sp. DSM 27419]